ncbi:MAG TPA: FeoC-like transcriptional regulator [Hyphomicrobiales bacterium]|nr:FeoC-like transcriptional regulator [Kaistiaceae bacterium]HQF30726.1 FeoC-like transcriptional regulator [Hyphomicrobiales bacterium]
MLVRDLNTYLAEHGRASMTDLVNRFGASPDALRAMLQMLIAKGRVARVEAETKCGGCTKCSPDTLEVYCWLKAA